MAVKRFNIKTDDGVARAMLARGSDTRRGFEAKGRQVGNKYRQLANIRLKYLKQTSPFEGSGNNPSVRRADIDVKIEGTKMEVVVNAPAAQYAETGRPEIVTDKPMFIRVKSSAKKTKRGKRGGKKFVLSKGAPVRKIGNQYFLLTKRVKAFEGHHLLREAVKSVFR